MKTLARIGASLAVLASALTLSSCSDDGQIVKARFVSAAPLVVGNQVKIDGIVVGKIESMRVVNGQAEVAMNLEPSAMPPPLAARSQIPAGSPCQRQPSMR